MENNNKKNLPKKDKNVDRLLMLAAEFDINVDQDNDSDPQCQASYGRNGSIEIDFC